jgi:hypothetical protein
MRTNNNFNVETFIIKYGDNNNNNSINFFTCLTTAKYGQLHPSKIQFNNSIQFFIISVIIIIIIHLFIYVLDNSHRYGQLQPSTKTTV